VSDNASRRTALSFDCPRRWRFTLAVLRTGRLRRLSRLHGGGGTLILLLVSCDIRGSVGQRERNVCCGCQGIRRKQKALLERLEQRLATMRRPDCDCGRRLAVPLAEKCLELASEHVFLPIRKMSDQGVTEGRALG